MVCCHSCNRAFLFQVDTNHNNKFVSIHLLYKLQKYPFTVDQVYRHVFVLFPEQFPAHSFGISNPADFLRLNNFVDEWYLRN